MLCSFTEKSAVGSGGGTAGGAADEIGFFRSECMENSPDPRRKLEEALEKLADELRASPTLPCDRENSSKP